MVTTETQKQAINLQKGIEVAKAAKKVRAQQIRATVVLLKQTFPLAFSDKCIPLKCHIFEDVVTYWQAHETEMGTLSKKLVRDTLQFYTSRLAYHEACLTKNAMRIDLTGAVIEAVSDQAKIHHQGCGDKIVAIHKKRSVQRNKKTKPSQGEIDIVKKANTTLEMKLQEAAITTDADGRPVLTLKKKS